MAHDGGMVGGRDSESASLPGREAALSSLFDLVSADVQAILVSGEAGIGKSSLLAAHQTATTRLVLWGQCVPMATTVALLPFLDALGTREVDARSAVDRAASMLPTHHAKALAAVLPRLTAGSETDSGSEDLLFSAVGELLAQLAGDQPVTLIVEDVHWADQATLDLLTYVMLARNDAGVSVVATYRSAQAESTPSAEAWLERMRMAPRVAEISLSPLDRAGFDEQLAVLAPELSREAGDRLFTRSEGNPFFTEQLVAALRGTDTDRLPSRLAGFLTSRIERVSPAAQLTMTALALIGRPVPDDAVARLVDLDEPDVAAVLAELAKASLVVITHREVRVSHALLNEAVLSRAPMQSRDLHARVGAELERMSPRDLAPEAAAHYRAAGLVEDELRASTAAAGRAWELAAYSESADWGLRALELLGDRNAAPGLAALAARTLRSLNHSGRHTDQDALGRRLWDRFENWPDATERGLVLTNVARRAVVRSRSGLPPEARKLLSDDTLPASVDHAGFLVAVAISLALGGELDEAMELFDHALSMSEQVGAAREAVVAASWHERLRRAQGDAELSDRLLARVDALVGTSDHVETFLAYAATTSDILLKRGRLKEAYDRAIAGVRTAHEHGLSSAVPTLGAECNAIEAALERGRVADAEAVVAIAGDRSDLQFDRRVIAALAFQRAALELVKAEPVLIARSHESGEADREAAEILAESLLWDGRAADAYTVAVGTGVELLGPSAALEWPMVGRLLTLAARAAADLAEAGRDATDRDAMAAAQERADEAEQLRERFVKLGDDPLRPRDTIARIRGDVTGWEAELGRARGTDTTEQWQRVGSMWEELGHPHRSSYGWWRAARRALREPVDRPAAADALRRAHAAADGHVPLLAAISELAGRLRLAGLGTHETLPGRDRHDTLTEQEQRVLRLVAQGRTNAEIAKELFISPKTASVHVSNILRKVGVPNRAAAAAWAHSVGLVEG